MLTLSFLGLVFAATDTSWHTDYDQAVRQALLEKKDLLIHFRGDTPMSSVFSRPDVRVRLALYVCLEVPANYQYDGKKLLDYAALREMMGRPGLAVISLHNDRLSQHREAISVHAFVRSRYHWAPGYGGEEVKAILDLPSTATLSQRSMIYAIRVHPERPQSVYCTCHSAFLGHAQRHSARQAGMQNQHHADLIGASRQLQGETGVYTSGASEVVAESWGAVVGGENVLEAAFSCVDAWRHSPGHWGAVSRPHRFFGYDIARGANGTWYATGIFAD